MTEIRIPIFATLDICLRSFKVTRGPESERKHNCDFFKIMKFMKVPKLNFYRTKHFERLPFDLTTE